MTNLLHLNQAIIPLIRNSLPSMIANQLAGVQPMSGSSAQIFSFKTRYNYDPYRIRFDKEHYNYFLRLNNRKKTHTQKDIEEAGYPYFSLNSINNSNQYYQCLDWCKETFGKHGFILHNYRIYFQTQEHRVQFILRWNDSQ